MSQVGWVEGNKIRKVKIMENTKQAYPDHPAYQKSNETWKSCTACGEYNDPDADHCWNCHYSF